MNRLLVPVLCLALCGCVTADPSPRETAKLNNALVRSQASQQRAEQLARSIGTDLDRMDGKSVLLIRWLSLHPDK